MAIATKKHPIRKENMASKDHPLHDLIPDPVFRNSYEGRAIGGVADMTVLRKALDARHNVLLDGPTGSAKTSFVYAFGAQVGLPVVNVPCHGAAEPREFIGGWTPQPDGSFAFVPGKMTLAAMHGGIIYLDEVNMAPPRILAFLHGALDRRRTITMVDAQGSDHPTSVVLHDRCMVIGAYNPGRGYEGARPLNLAFKNRFAIKLHFGYHPTVESKLVESRALLKLATDMRARVDLGDFTVPIATNMLLEFEEFALDPDLGPDWAAANFVAAFPAEEQEPVSELVKLHLANIKKELKTN